MRKLKILMLEPYFTGSHKAWLNSYQQFSSHQIDLITLPGRHWKWRMHGGAISLANIYNKGNYNPDLLVVSDMLNLPLFIALTKIDKPIAVYFHENQLTYPWSKTDKDVALKRDNHYAFINVSTALVATHNYFNSNYHKTSFLEAISPFLKQFPDKREMESQGIIAQKSSILYLGMDLKKLLPFQKIKREGPAVLLWNHRWEYDKNPKAFFETLIRLKEENISFKLIVLGQSFQKIPPIFLKAKSVLKNEIIHWGFADSFEAYAKCLAMSDIYPVTSQQDFFGGSVVEAIYCNTYPILANRLAYPEHIPTEHQDLHLYNGQDHFYALLKNAINSVAQIRQQDHFRNFVAHYDWNILAPKYDQAYLDLVNSQKDNQAKEVD